MSIATLNIFYGLLIYITGGDYITTVPDYFYDGINWFEFSGGGRAPALCGQPADGAVVRQLPAHLAAAQRHQYRAADLRHGRQPGCRAAARFSLFRLNLFVYGYMGFIAGIASIAHAQLQLNVTPTVLVGRELTVLAAVVLGGASLLGGIGTVLGTFPRLVLAGHPAERAGDPGFAGALGRRVSGLVILIAVAATALEATRKANAKRAARQPKETGAAA